MHRMLAAALATLQGTAALASRPNVPKRCTAARLRCAAPLRATDVPRRCAARLRATDEDIEYIFEDDAWGEDEDDEVFEAEMRLRAAAEHESYASRTTALAQTGDAAGAVQSRGVALVADCLPDASVRDALRRRILERRDAGAGLSSVLGATDVDDATLRFDIRLPYDDVVSEATASLLRRGAPLADALDALVGPHAQLWECAALISEAGAPPQCVHADTFWDAAPCLFTAFVALQDVTADLGPTLFFPGSHRSADAQDDLEDGPSVLDAYSAEVGVMGAGSGLCGNQPVS